MSAVASNPLSEAETAEMARLEEALRSARHKYYRLRDQASEAVKLRNAAAREEKKLGHLWLLLAERKHAA